MVLIVTARDTHNTRSIRIWWQREFFFSFLLSHSKRLRRSCEIGSLHHHATSWRQHSKRKVSSVSFDRSSISCAVESLVKPKFFLSDLQACCVNKKSKKTKKTKQHFEMPRASSLSHYSIIRSTSSSQLASTARWNTHTQKRKTNTKPQASTRGVFDHPMLSLISIGFFHVKYCTVPTVFVPYEKPSFSDIQLAH